MAIKVKKKKKILSLLTSGGIRDRQNLELS